MAFKLTLVCFIIAAAAIAQAARRHESYYKHDIPENNNYPAFVRVRDPEDRFKDFLQRPRRSCVALGGTGCEGNNGKCCRKGNPYTGTMRKCVNAGTFSQRVYKCVEP